MLSAKRTLHEHEGKFGQKEHWSFKLIILFMYSLLVTSQRSYQILRGNVQIIHDLQSSYKYDRYIQIDLRYNIACSWRLYPAHMGIISVGLQVMTSLGSKTQDHVLISAYFSACLSIKCINSDTVKIAAVCSNVLYTATDAVHGLRRSISLHFDNNCACNCRLRVRPL